ncbi:hypothetical protein [uncultured Endozoicomonas sp.]|uniref:hypothetical protein n=1 Tax=uncultured Endozoicomonas sp. TaxID=432652 RepID=UPI0026207D4D|nr:hypothetical protein [uncultured Endozoicomonas sp.]
MALSPPSPNPPLPTMTIKDVEENNERLFARWKYKSGTELNLQNTAIASISSGAFFAGLMVALAFPTLLIVGAGLAAACLTPALIKLRYRSIRPANTQELRAIFNHAKNDQVNYNKELQEQKKLINELEMRLKIYDDPDGELHQPLKTEKEQSKINAVEAMKEALDRYNSQQSRLSSLLLLLRERIQREINRWIAENSQNRCKHPQKDCEAYTDLEEINIPSHLKITIDELTEILDDTIFNIGAYGLTNQAKSDLKICLSNFALHFPERINHYPNARSIFDSSFLDHFIIKPTLSSCYTMGPHETKHYELSEKISSEKIKVISINIQFEHLNKYYNSAITNSSGQFDDRNNERFDARIFQNLIPV